jgi:hypothetical protein
MRKTPQTYLLTLNSPSQRALRLWTGRSIHTLRHCSVKQIGSALIEMQKNVDNLQKHMRTLQQVKEQLVSVSAEGGGQTLKEDNGSLRKTARLTGHDRGRASKVIQKREL